jgi:uncharacterized protein (DUF1800 family)
MFTSQKQYWVRSIGGTAATFCQPHLPACYKLAICRKCNLRTIHFTLATTKKTMPDTTELATKANDASPALPAASASIVRAPSAHAPVSEPGSRLVKAGTLSVLSAAALAACGGGGGGPTAGNMQPGSNGVPSNVPVPDLVILNAAQLPGSGGPAPAAPTAADRPGAADAARFLTQATYGITSSQQISQVQTKGFSLWLWEQFNTGTTLHTSYLDQQKLRNVDDKGVARASEEMSYEAVWQQWLGGADQLRARTAFALLQIVVISNVAPDIRPYAMSSYMDMLNRNAFGNYRQVLKEVTLHPAMGYYLNMINSERDNAETGAHPNENYAREVLQLFSIGLVKLNQDGSQQLDSASKPVPTYDESVVQGFAKAFTGWSYANATGFDEADEEVPQAWISPMKPFSSQHSPEAKKLLNGVTLPAGGSPQQDLEAAVDNIFNHDNVPPFISRQLIQRLVTSNPSKAYISRVAGVFINNGSGVRGDLRAVVSAILLDTEARQTPLPANFGKQREPVIRFANFLRGLDAKAENGRNAIHYLESADNGLGQSPLLSPSVFNFYSPNFRPAGKIAQAGLVAPEFQITTETTVVGGLNFFASLFNNGGYGNDESRLKLNFAPLKALAATPAALVAELNALFFNYAMGTPLQTRMTTMLAALPADDPERRVKAALILTSLSPEYVIQK